MKLSYITESKAIIHDTAKAIGELIKYVYAKNNSSTKTALNNFLKQPNPQNWENTKWVIDQVIKTAINDPDAQPHLNAWGQLKKMTAPVITAAVYDIEPKQAKGTPLQQLVLGKGIRDKYKMALGPQGYVGTMSNVGDIGTSKLKDMLKTMSKNGAATAKATKQDMPNVRQTPKF